MSSNIKLPDGLSLMPFQVEAVQFLVSKTRALIASEPGLGKTVQLISAVNTVLDKGGKVCVLCPKSMKLTWKREIEKWGMPDIEWHVQNYDQLLHKGFNEIAVKRDVLICDESHECIKNPNTRRCAALTGILPMFDRVYLSTATPASRSGFDYYMTLKVLLPKLMEDISDWDFRKIYCNKVPEPFSPSGFKYEGFRNTAILKKIFQACAIKHRKSEVARQLPSKTVSYVPLAVKHVWDSSKNEYLLKALAEGREVGHNYQQELQQIAAAKLNDIANWVESFPETEPLVVFAWHRSIVDMLIEKITEFRGEVGKITGEVNNINIRQNLIDRFQAKELNTLVLNMQSGGVGITLTAASTALYVQPPMSYIHLEQSENRVHRIGSERPVQIVRFVAEGTVEEQMYRVLDERAASIREVGV